MVNVLVFFVLGAFLFGHGVILVYRPSLLLELYNRFYAKVLGSRQWFWHDPEPLKHGFDLWSARVTGVPFALFGLYLMVQAFIGFCGMLASGDMPFIVQPAEQPPPSPRAVTPEGRVMGVAVAVVIFALGLVLALTPKTGARILGEGRYYTSRVPETMWRIVGVGFCAAGAMVFLQSLG